MIPTDKLRAFFTDYENRVNKALKDPADLDIEGVVSCFAPSFIEASPLGVKAFHNDISFREAIPKGYEFYRQIGTGSIRILKIDFTEIDGFHIMARVTWDSRHMKSGDEIIINFDVVYFLQFLGGNPKIFGYITGDERGILRQYGLID